MKSIGIVRKFDALGRIVIPKEVRNTLGWNDKVPIEMFTQGNSVVLRSYVPGCTFCNNSDNLERHKGLLLCCECIAEIKNNF